MDMIVNTLDQCTGLLEATALNEQLRTELIDVDKFIRVNDLREVTNPVFFNGPVPTPDGLLSNEIFGITKTERAGIYAYIDLGGEFLQPIVYKTLCKLNNKIPDVICGIDTFKINESGELVRDTEGDTGIDWFKKNFEKIKFKKTGSITRDRMIKFIELVQGQMWIDKFIVIPPYYRDVESRESGMGVGEINKLYSSLIIAVKSLKATSDFGLTLFDSSKARIQNILVQIFDWFGMGTTINGKETPANLPGKMGLLKHGLLYKTVDYSTRLVMSAPDVSGETVEDLMVDMNHAALPLASAICNFKPFIIFWVRRFFENLFAGKMEYPVAINDKEFVNVPLQDYQVAFSDMEIEKQIERYIHGYSNRFIPVPLPVDKAVLADRAKGNKLVTADGRPVKLTEIDTYLGFVGYKLNTNEKFDEKKDYSSYVKIERPLTWCDIFFVAACEVTKDKMCLITRFPIDSYLNQYPSKVRIKSTIKTTPMVVELIEGQENYTRSKYFRWYPVIEGSDIGANTASMFEDTLSICNGLIGAMGMDYDGDTAIVKPVYTIEANQECEKAANSKIQVLGMDGQTTRDVSKENIITLYELTIHPDPTVKLVDPIF